MSVKRWRAHVAAAALSAVAIGVFAAPAAAAPPANTAPPSISGTPTVGQTLTAVSATFNLPLFWHPGFTLPVFKTPNVFRDCPIRALAERIAGQGVLDAANIGKEANSLYLKPETWKGWASHEEILAQFRRLWHVLVLFGNPRSGAADT